MLDQRPRSFSPLVLREEITHTPVIPVRRHSLASKRLKLQYTGIALLYLFDVRNQDSKLPHFGS